MKFIDISHHQPEDFPFEAMKLAGYSGVIIRTGDGEKRDKRVDHFVERAKEAGFVVWLYHFGRAKNHNDAVDEAYITIDVMKRHNLPSTTMVFYDQEVNKKKTENTSAFNGFLEAMRNNIIGIRVGLYTNEYSFNTYFNKDYMKNFPLWIAKYSAKAPAVGFPIYGWQYTSSPDNSEPYKQALDRSIFYTTDLDDLNPPVKPPNEYEMPVEPEELVIDVIHNKYGVGINRIKTLTELGFDATSVQKRVNQYYKCAQDVMAGKYDNMPYRKDKVEKAGFNYEVVRSIVMAMYY